MPVSNDAGVLSFSSTWPVVIAMDGPPVSVR